MPTFRLKNFIDASMQTTFLKPGYGELVGITGLYHGFPARELVEILTPWEIGQLLGGN